MVRITSITPLPPTVIRCAFDTGQTAEIDVLRFLETDSFRGVFSALADPAIFAKAAIGPRGRSLEWPGEIDFCADALHQWAFAKDPGASAQAA